MTDLEEYDFEAAGDENHLCNICLMMIKNAVEIECPHTFCALCLEEWQSNANAREGDSFYCPTCRTLYRNDQVHRSKYLDRIIKAKMLVKCKKHKLGCEWVATIDDYFKLHESTCEYRIVNCEMCNEQYTYNERQEHSRKCYKRCPNAGCNKLLKEEQIPFHLKNECLHEVVTCSYSRYGCVTRMKRYMIDEHHQIAWKHHLELFNHRHDTLTQENSTLKQTIAQLEHKLQQQQQEQLQPQQEQQQQQSQTPPLSTPPLSTPLSPPLSTPLSPPLSTPLSSPVSCLSAEDRRKDWTFGELVDLLKNKSTHDKFNAIIVSKPSLRAHRTLLHMAAKQGATECVETLIANGCNVKEKDNNGEMAIHHAATNNSTQVIKILLSRDPSLINATDNSKNTPLHCAAYGNHPETVEFLLSQLSVDVNIKNDGEWTPDKCGSNNQIERMIQSHHNYSTDAKSKWKFW